MFALRHIKTGRFMPQTVNNRGYSHWDPDSPAVTPDAAIRGSTRLFPTRKGAENARVTWAFGEARRKYHGPSGSYWDPDEGGDDYIAYVDKGRHKDMLEIVPMLVQPATENVVLRVSADLAGIIEQLGEEGVDKVLRDFINQKGTTT